MSIRTLHYNLLREFPYSPTHGQEEAIGLLSGFVFSKKDQFPVFVLKGFAGTGKTTLVSALVKALPTVGFQSALLAPTGRAAKILAGYSGKPAFTIHKKIYLIKMKASGEIRLSLARNNEENTLFIVDEASMIQGGNGTGDGSFFQSRNVLEDLLEYVFSGNNCKLVLLGDPAQLPPVGMNLSPALDLDLLKESYNFDITTCTLTDVVRQSENSGILDVATGIRMKIDASFAVLPLFGKMNGSADVQCIRGDEMTDALLSAYSNSGHDNTVVITRSNKRANQYNQGIRQRLLFQENEISSGDLLMVVRNNYFWLPEDSKAGFIANGDLIKVQRIGGYHELYGFRFADATITLVDYPEEPPLETKLLLDTLFSESPSLTQDENYRFFNTVLQDYSDLPSKRKRFEKVRTNPYFNALQVKHAHALTCHKTQGGQWETVFLEKGYLTDNMIDVEYLRWLYTAVTRATRKLYLINFEERFFE